MPHLSPTTLTTDEQRLILRATAGNVRDQTIISLALATGLRLAEVVGLDVGDVFVPDGTPRVRVRIRAVIAKGGRAADVFLPDRLITKLRRFWRWKRERGEDFSPDAPLFANQSGRRISKRRVQFAWATWQRRAGFDRVYGFHALRHTAVTNVYRASRDLFLAQRFARHVSPLTTVIYTQSSVKEMVARVRGLECGIAALRGPLERPAFGAYFRQFRKEDVMRFASLSVLLATLAIGFGGGSVGAVGTSAQPAPPGTATVPYTVVEQWNIGGAGGYGRVIVVDPAQRSEEGLLALADQLRRDASADRNAVVYIYDEPMAAKMRKDADSERLGYGDQKLHDDHMIGTYAKIANTGFHAVTMFLQGANGPSKEVALR